MSKPPPEKPEAVKVTPPKAATPATKSVTPAEPLKPKPKVTPAKVPPKPKKPDAPNEPPKTSRVDTDFSTINIHKPRSIVLRDIHMSYNTRMGRNHVLRGINLAVDPTRSLGILGRNGAGKSTLISILSGLLQPDSGQIHYNGTRLSWPIGRPAFQGSLSAINNIKFVCRIMGVEIAPVIAYVEDFAELGKYMYMPIKTYSSGMRSRLGFALSMAIDCDSLLVDEGFSAGDARFRKKMKEVFEEKRKGKNMICVSHGGSVIKQFCDYAGILHNGKLTIYDDVNEAFALYQEL